LKRLNNYFELTYDYSKGEIFTPEELADEIVDNLEKIKPELFIGKNKTFCVPSCAYGIFIIKIVDKLVECGHSIENAKSRVYGFEKRLKYVNKLKRKGYNVILKDFLNGEINMKFDVILGNPPYHEHEHSSIKLWKKFVIKGEEILKDNGILSFVIPVSWSKPLRSTSKGNDKLCGEIFRKHTLLNYNLDINSYFGNGSLDISYVTFKKDYNNNNFSYIHKNKTVSDILNKIILNSDKSIKLLHYANTPWHRGIKRVDKKSKEFSIPLVENVDKFKYTNVDDIELRNRKKIHIPRVFGFNFIGDNGKYGLGYQAECILLEELESVEYALDYFNSKLISTILKEVKWIPQADYSVLELLPRLDFSKKWSDSGLYKEFNLTQEEIDYIENYVG